MGAEKQNPHQEIGVKLPEGRMFRVRPFQCSLESLGQTKKDCLGGEVTADPEEEQCKAASLFSRADGNVGGHTVGGGAQCFKSELVPFEHVVFEFLLQGGGRA